jgi:penicillin V acylase-like amidase (Ntn superfamily)
MMETDMKKNLLYFLELFMIFLCYGQKSIHINPITRHSCTSFCLDNNGYAVFGTNYDHKKMLDEGIIFVNKRNVSKSYWLKKDSKSEHAQWTSKYGSVTFNLVINQFAWAGMNEAGLVISTMELMGSQSPAPDKRPWINAGFWVQYLLDNYNTVEEVLASDSLIRVSGYVDHYLVCDREGNCAAIEFLEGKMVYHTGNKLPIKVLANNAYAESTAEWEKYGKQVSHGKPVSINNSGLKRFIIGAKRVRDFKPTDSESAIKYAFETLLEVSGQKVKGSPTYWSIVMDTQNFRIYFRTHTNPEIRCINLPELDFSCKEPVKMLDINEKLRGDITNKLKSYSSKAHFDHSLKAYKNWGQPIGSGTLKRHIKYLESFTCKESNVK